MKLRIIVFLLCVLVPLSLLHGQESVGLTSVSQPIADQSQQQREIQPQHLVKLFELPQESYEIGSLAISPNDELIAYTIDRRKLKGAKRALTFNTDKLFAADTTLKIWNRSTGQIQFTVQDETVGGFSKMRFTDDSSTLLTEKSDKGFSGLALTFWDVETGRVIANIPAPLKEPVNSMLSPDHKFYAVALKAGTVSLWSLPKGELVASLGTPPKKRSWLQRMGSNEIDEDYWLNLYFSPDSSLLVTSGRGRATHEIETRVWDLATGKLKYTLAGADTASWAAYGSNLFSRDGNLIATTVSERDGGGWVTSCRVKLWNSKDGSLWRTLEGARDPTSFSPDGKRLATGLIRSKKAGTKDVVGEIWNLEKGEVENRLTDPEGTLDQSFWSGDGRTLATIGGSTYTLTLWDADSGKMRNQIRLVRHHCFDPISECISDQDSILMSPDGRFLIAVSEKSFRLIDLKSASLLETIEGIEPLAFLSHGELATLSADKKSVVIWEIRP